MTTSSFKLQPPPMTVSEIAALTKATALPPARPDRQIFGVAALDLAGPNDLTFIESAKYIDHFLHTKAGACLISPRFEHRVPAGVDLLRVAHPYRAFVEVARKMFEATLRPASMFGASDIAPGAVVHPSARCEAGVTIDPGAVIGPGAEIGAGTIIGANAVIGPSVCIGRDCAIGAGVTVMHALIGDRVIIHPGCHIGQDGFGFVMGAGGHMKIPQLSRVIIQDDVEIGASTTVDRGALRDTVIGEGTKIDNQVQIGHNVSIGRHCVIVAQTGISGSATLKDFVVLGARAAVNTHVTIGEGAHLAGTAVVFGDVPAGARWGGVLAKPMKQWFRELTWVTQSANRDRGAGKTTDADVADDRGQE
jgi:UDP-3-O-[3-hydroxymyristoyl] glucosamine N-acyltransferase